jgi:heme-degrading monooxygenase HmoA
MIRHTVTFKLKHPKGSPQERAFMEAALKLSAIPGVHKFEYLRQIRKQNNYDYGISMEFDTQKEYDEYSNHRDHIAFVQSIWMKDVAEFLEVDYEPMIA